MKNKHLIIVLLLCSNTLLGQHLSYFNKTLVSDTMNILAQSVLPVEGGYISLGGYATSEHYAMYIRKLDNNGNTEWIKSFLTEQNASNIGIIEWGGQVIVDNNHLVATYLKNNDIWLTKFNLNGDTVLHKQYLKPARQVSLQILKTSVAGGYIIAGRELNITADTVKAYVLKLDSLGNFEWDRYYTMGNDARFFTVQQTPWDGGYIFGGMGYSTATGYDMFVVKTDSIGDTLWTKHYGSQGFDCGAYVVPLTTLAEYQAGIPIEYLMTGCYQSNTPDPLFDYVDDLYTAKLDSLGNIIWQKIYSTAPDNLYLQTFPIVKSDKSFIATGVYLNYATDYQTIPLIIKFNANGTIAWQKAVTLSSQVDCYIKDMRPTEDGGYVLAGYQYSTPQTAWVLKIDSLGNTCSFVGCDSTIYTGYPIGLDEVLLNKTGFSIVPNPAQDVVTLQLLQPINNSSNLLVYDISGRLVITINGVYNGMPINVQYLQTGMYYCRLLDSNKTEKLVIIR
jgi:hypothetical protein